MALSFFVNKKGRTFVGYRRIAKHLGINKDTVTRFVRRLIASGLVRRLDSHEEGKPSELFRPKELNKELFKEEKRFLKNGKMESVDEILKRSNPALEEMRKRWGRRK